MEVREAREIREELVNAATHGLGIVLTLAGGALLLTLAAVRGSAWELTGVAIFVATLFLLYAASTCYHAVRANALKRRLRVLDHCAIYLLIAGTFTPFALGPMRGVAGLSMLAVLWVLACAGVVFKLFLTGRYDRLSTATYVAMGWLAGLAAVPAAEALKPATLAWLVAGGIVYTAGTAFYHARRLPYAHGLWHLFVLAGSACHLTAVGVQL
ncbi:MAG TPA: hemolysin III family protein [Longimicrobiales bacterium]|nr:hemolysin III family protein [Longimicrobiales bacterium]